MNYTFIGNSERSMYSDFWGTPVNFDLKHFRAEECSAFKEYWAGGIFSGDFDCIVILVNGVPINLLPEDSAELRAISEIRGEVDVLVKELSNVKRREAAERLKAHNAAKDKEHALIDDIQRQIEILNDFQAQHDLPLTRIVISR